MARSSTPTNPSPGRPAGAAPADIDPTDLPDEARDAVAEPEPAAGRETEPRADATEREANGSAPRRRPGPGPSARPRRSWDVEDARDAGDAERPAATGAASGGVDSAGAGDGGGGEETGALRPGRTSGRAARRAPRPAPRPVERTDTDIDTDADAHGATDLDAEFPDDDEDAYDDAVAAGRPTGARVLTPAGLRRIPTNYLWWLVAVLGALAVGLTVVTVTVFTDWRHAEARSSARAEVPSLAKTYAAKILAYDYRHLQQDADSAAAVLTGDYAQQYRHSMDTLIIPLATQIKAAVRAEVLGAGVVRVDPEGDEATVLVFANQTVTNTRIKGSRVDQVRVRLTLIRQGHTWKVSKLDSL